MKNVTIYLEPNKRVPFPIRLMLLLLLNCYFIAILYNVLVLSLKVWCIDVHFKPLSYVLEKHVITAKS